MASPTLGNRRISIADWGLLARYIFSSGKRKPLRNLLFPLEPARHSRTPGRAAAMVLARVGRRTVQAAARETWRAPVSASETASRFRTGSLDPGKQGLGFETCRLVVRDGSSFSASAAALAAARRTRVPPLTSSSFAAVQELTRSPGARQFTRLVVGGAVVAAGGCGLARCDASGAPDAPGALRKLFGFETPRVDEGPAVDGRNELDTIKEHDTARDDCTGPNKTDTTVADDASATESSSETAPPSHLIGWHLLLSLAKQHWPALLLTVVVTVVASFLKLTSVRHMSKLYDLIGTQGGGSGSGGIPAKPLLELAGLRAAEAFAKYVLVRVSGNTRVEMETSLRRRLFAAFITEDMAVLEQRSSGETRTRLGHEATQIADVVARSITGGVKSVAVICHGVVSLVRLSWEISAVALGMVPPGVLLFSAVGAVSAAAHRNAAVANGRAASLAAERVAGVRTVRAFAKEVDEDSRYATALEHAAATRKIAIHAHAVHLALFAAVPATAVAAWLWYGGQLVECGRLTVGELTTVVPLAMEVAGALAGLSELSAELKRGLVAADAAAHVLGAPQKVETNVRRNLNSVVEKSLRKRRGQGKGVDENTTNTFSKTKTNTFSDKNKKPPPSGAVCFHDVHFAYPSRPEVDVLLGFSLELKPGEVFALVGRSGGGKSTVGALLERMYDPKKGTVRIDGEDVSAVDLTWLRGSIGHVSQSPTLFDGTIRENIAYAVGGVDNKTVSFEEVTAAAKTANAHEFIMNFPDGYETRVGENGTFLSGGQKQRIAIARVVMANPSVLLLDEATSALDAESESAVSLALEKVQSGRTTILVAHRLSTVRRADRVGVLHEGKLVECGTHQELMAKKNGRYRALVETQLARE